MTAIPISYSFRNLYVRLGATIMTVAGLSLALSIFVFVQALIHGLNATLIHTGDPRNVLVMRQGAEAEIESTVDKQAIETVRSLPGVATGADGRPLVSGETVFEVLLPRADQTGDANVTVRGLTSAGISLRGSVHLLGGRWFQSGKHEIVVSDKIQNRFANCTLGSSVRFNQGLWTIVGIFDASHTAYDSEIWTDVNQANADFQQTSVSSIWLQAQDSKAAGALVAKVQADRRLGLDGQLETDYFAKQTESGEIIGLIGTVVAVIMAVGACFGAMNTMYGSVAYRSREIGTLRILGFTRASIMAAFLLESTFLALLAGLIGIACMLPLNGITTGTRNQVTFSETVFSIQLTPQIALQCFLCCLLLGLAGGLAPAWRASQQNIVDALRN